MKEDISPSSSCEDGDFSVDWNALPFGPLSTYKGLNYFSFKVHGDIGKKVKKKKKKKGKEREKERKQI